MWLVEKKIYYHILDVGYEGVGIPVRVKFEFDVREGKYIQKKPELGASIQCRPTFKKISQLRFRAIRTRCI